MSFSNITSGVGNVLGDIFGSSMAPSMPSVGGITGSTMTTMFGTPTAAQTEAMSKTQADITKYQTAQAKTQQQITALTSQLQTLTGSARQSALDKLNSLQNTYNKQQADITKYQTQQQTEQTALTKQQQGSYENQMLSAIGQYLPQFQNLAAQQTGAATQAALQNLQANAPAYQQLAQQLTNQSIAGGIGAQQQYGLQAGQTLQQQMQALNPQFFAGQTQLGNQLISAATGGPGGTPQGLTPQQTQYFQQQLAANQASQGLYGSPLSSQNMALQLTPLNMQQQQQNIQNLQNYLNTYQASGVPNYLTPTQYTGAQLMGTGLQPQQTTAGSLAGGSLSPLSTQYLTNMQAALTSANYAQGMNQATSLGSSLGGLAGNILGDLTSLGTSGIGSLGSGNALGGGASSIFGGLTSGLSSMEGVFG